MRAAAPPAVFASGSPASCASGGLEGVVVGDRHGEVEIHNAQPEPEPLDWSCLVGRQARQARQATEFIPCRHSSSQSGR